MTRKQFKAEVVADLEYQLEHKGKDWTSEHWYLSDVLYPVRRSEKIVAINELIKEGEIVRIPASRLFHQYSDADFPVLLLNH
jgi:hypothetical protein